MGGRVYIGTSGFTYKSWNAHFYPPELPTRLQLEFYATQFPTVEINTTFYRLPGESMVKGWARRVPKTFVYALKGSRFITHMKKLANLDEPVKRPRYPNARIPKGNGLDIYFGRIAPMKMRTGGAPETVPAGKPARSASNGERSLRNWPETLVTICITWE